MPFPLFAALAGGAASGATSGLMGMLPAIGRGGGGKRLSRGIMRELQEWLKAGGLKRELAAADEQRRLQLASFQPMEEFYRGMIPGKFGELSPASQAFRDRELESLLSSKASEEVASTGALQRRFGGRLPAPYFSSLLGNLGREMQSQRTGIGREATMRNVELGQAGAAGLGQVAAMRGLPSPAMELFSPLAGGVMKGGGGGSSAWGALGAGLQSAGPLLGRLETWLADRAARNKMMPPRTWTWLTPPPTPGGPWGGLT